MESNSISQNPYNEAFKDFLTSLASNVDTKDITYFTEGVILAFFIFICYLELNPKIGGIMFRPWSDGETYFNPLGIIPILKYPFQSNHFWKPENWDLNFITFSALFNCGNLLLNDCWVIQILFASAFNIKGLQTFVVAGYQLVKNQIKVVLLVSHFQSRHQRSYKS